jgi:hypothetical protein
MRPILLCLALLGGCGAVGDRSPRDRAAGNESAAADAEAGEEAAESAVQTATLTGRYEGGTGAERSQLCIIDRGTGNSRFGLVLRTGAGTCSGAGRALRQDRRLTLDMAGDQACRIDATIDGRRVAFPAGDPAGCAYYCAPGAALTNATFDKVGGSAEDAMQARDLVGDPLCG